MANGKNPLLVSAGDDVGKKRGSVSDYTPTANQSIDFFCDYNPPSGEVNLNFPDESCAVELGEAVAWAGEQVAVDEIVDSNYCDAQQGEVAEFDLETLNPVGELTAWDGSEFERFNLRVTAIARLSGEAYEGESAEASLLKHTLIAPTFDAGDEFSVELKTWKVEYFDPAFDSGESAEAELQTSDFLPLLAHSGEYTPRIPLFTYSTFAPTFDTGTRADASLWIPSVALSELNGWKGEWAGAELVTEIRIAATVDAGEVAEVELASDKRLEGEAYSGEQVEADILTDIQFEGEAFAGEIVECTIIDAKTIDAVARSGEVAETELDTEPHLYTEAFDGSETALNFETETQFDAEGYSGGEQVEITLNTEPHFDAEAFDGHLVTAQMTDDKLLDCVWYDGAWASATLTDDKRLEAVARDGVEVAASLTDDRRLEAIAYDGERASAALETSLSAIAYSGELVEITLADDLALEAVARAGEFVGATLTDDKRFDAVAYSGEQAETELKEDKTIAVTLIVGERAEVDIESHPAASLAPEAFDGSQSEVNNDSLKLIAHAGERASLSLSTRNNLFAIAQAGEYSTLTFAAHPAAEMTFTAADGFAGIIDNLWISEVPLGTLIADSGERGEIDYLGEEKNIVAHTGEVVWASIRTEDALQARAHEGASVDCDLYERPSEPLGDFVACNGETLFVSDFITQIHADLSVVVWHDHRIQVDIDSQTYFDLMTDGCCGGPRPLNQQNLRIELDLAEYPDQEHVGDRVIFTADIACNTNLEATAHGGEHFALIDNSVILSLDDRGEPNLAFAQGEALRLEAFDAWNIHRLCYGNFIPDGGNIIIELSDEIDENCYMDAIWTGETVFFEFVNTVDVSFAPRSGETLMVALTEDKPWELRALHGERCNFALSTTIRFGADAAEGSYGWGRFWEPTWDAHTGEVAEVAIEVEVGVEFMEVGCLENEYIYMDERGEPIPELFTPVPVELDPYQHDIKARCF